MDADRRMEIAIGQMLRYGVILSGLVVALGGALYLGASKGVVVSYASFRAAKPELRTIAGIMHGVAAHDAASLIQLGILMLVATPIVRVVFCLVGFTLERDKTYIAISLLVLGILTYSLLHGA
jgi:uncharacterized membrane protein